MISKSRFFVSKYRIFDQSLKSRKICEVFHRTWILNRTRLFSCKNSWTFFRDFKSRYFYILFVSSRISNKKMQIFCQKLPKFFKTTIFFFKNEPFYQWRWFGWRKIFRSCIIWCDQNSCQRFRESDNIRWFWNFQTNHSWRGNFFIFSKFQKMNFGEHFFDMFRCENGPLRFLRVVAFITTKRFPLNEFQREFMVSNC